MTDQELDAKVTEVLKWPPSVRNATEIEYLEEQRARTFQKMEGLHSKAEAEHRNLSSDEDSEYRSLADRFALLGHEIARTPTPAKS